MVRSYTDVNLQIGTYQYYVHVYSNGLSFVSASSNIVTVTVSVNPAIPIPPSDLSPSGSSASSIGIYWFDNSINETEFRIERRFNNDSWTQVGTVLGNETTHATTNLPTVYTDTQPSGAGTYQYRVKACSSSGCSVESNTISRTIDASAPVTPTGLAATYSTSSGSVRVSWADASIDEWGFRLFRRIYNSHSWFGVATIVNRSSNNAISFTDTYQLATNTTYEYVVRSYNTYESATRISLL